MVASFSKEHVELAGGCPEEMALTVAINGLRATWHRHPGGVLKAEDRAILEFAAILCIRLLSLPRVPLMEGGIGDGVRP